MILLVDIGNTRLKWSLWSQGAHTRSGAFAYEIPLFSRNLDFEWRGIAAPERVLVCNVAGAKLADTLYDWVKNHWQLHTEFTKAQKQGNGVTNSYSRPDRLGADRWIALIAARQLLGTAATCVVDCGTAITADVLDANGQHLGGVIAPGLAAMCNSLSRDTAGVGTLHQTFPPPELTLATDTQNGVLVGTRLAAAALLDRVMDDAQRQLGVTVSGVITGGDAPILLPLLRSAFRHEPLLVLNGLARMAEGAE